MDKEIYITLIYKSLKGAITPEEQERLNAFREESRANEMLLEEVEMAWTLSKAPDTLPEIDVEADLKKVRQRMAPASNTIKSSADQPASPKVIPLRRRWMSMAAGFALFCLAAFVVYQYLQSPSMQSIAADTSVRHIQLKDGSEVWLKPGSTLHFPKTFAADARAVTLQGEAYFEVEHNAQAPFSVQVGSNEIRVLGTSFSITEDRLEKTLEVNVQSGKVQVSTPKASVVLIKGERATYEADSDQLVKQQANTQNSIVWKTGRFVFREENLDVAIRSIANEFGISIDIQDKKLYTCKLSAIVNRGSPQEVLAKIAEIQTMEVQQIDPSTYVLVNGKCQ